MHKNAEEKLPVFLGLKLKNTMNKKKRNFFRANLQKEKPCYNHFNNKEMFLPGVQGGSGEK